MSELTPRQAERKERILRTVRDHLSRYGYDGLSMRAVADGAGVSPTTLYNQFQNKGGLVLAAQEDLLLHLAASASREKAGFQRLVAVAEAVADQVVQTPRYAEAAARMLFNSQPGDSTCRLLLGDAMVRNREILAEMQELDELRPEVDLDLLARDLVGDSWSTILLWMKGFIALQDFKRQFLRRLFATMTPVMTPAAARRHRKRFEATPLQPA